MYEHYLTAFRNGVIDVDINIDPEKFWDQIDLDAETDDQSNVRPSNDAVTVTVTFAVTTDAEASVIVSGDGLVHPAFGGTGTPDRELDEYAEQAIEIWRAITGNQAQTFQYATAEATTAASEPTDEHIINA